MSSLVAQALAVPAPGAAAWVWGTVAWSACTIGGGAHSPGPSETAWCATVDVPENHAQPSGRRIALHLAVLRAHARDADPDPVVFLDGGPGGAATQDYPAIAPALTPLRKHRHILLIDQRGTGQSHPLDCGAAETSPADGDEDVHASARERALARVDACATKLRGEADPRFYATQDAVQDLEFVRRALGVPRFNLLGVSYGTRVAQQYARRYPAAVRSLVLDGAVPNSLVLLSEHAANLEDAVRRRLAQCVSTPACQARYGDPYASLKHLQAALHLHPVSVDIRDAQTFALQRHRLHEEDLAALVRFYAYSATTSALLPYVIAQAAQGDYAPLLTQARFVSADVQERVSGGMAASVFCAEDADSLHPQPQDEGTLLGSDFIADALATCQRWPHGTRAADFREPLRSEVPALVLAGEFDPVTPERYAQAVLAGLPRGRLLLLKGQGHAVASVGCMPHLLERFVARADAATLDAHCLDTLVTMPAFLDANGAAP